MKKRITKFTFIGLIILASPLTRAVDYSILPDYSNDINGLIVLIIRAILSLLLIIAALFLIVGGYRYLTAAGNAESIQKAKSTILYSVVGLVVIIISFAIVRFIFSTFLIP